jgi:hypothetical protein
MDDLALPLVAEDTGEFFGKIAVAAKLALTVCKRHGVEVHFRAGRTEAMVFLHCRGSDLRHGLLLQHIQLGRMAL